MNRWILAALACFSIMTAANAADLPADKINAFVRGQTTKDQVLQSLGTPSFANHNPDGRSALLYSYTVPVTEKNKSLHEAVVALLFDAHDVFLGLRVYAKNADGAQPAQPAAATHGLAYENVLMPLPDGFKLGYQAAQGQVKMMEFVPNAETVENWSRIVTEQIFLGARNADPSALPNAMTPGLISKCQGATMRELSKTKENGYPAVIWGFECPMNPVTHRPETMWMKVISGADSLYSVQYAYRRAPADDMAREALGFLQRVSACDTRTPTHPCPNLIPANSSPPAAAEISPRSPALGSP
jgi:outer membrane protein assembly factor BamE (lipoprotein component of BamABCDE complex)